MQKVIFIWYYWHVSWNISKRLLNVYFLFSLWFWYQILVIDSFVRYQDKFNLAYLGYLYFSGTYIVQGFEIYSWKLLTSVRLQHVALSSWEMCEVILSALNLICFSKALKSSYFHLMKICISLQWRHNELNGVSNHQPHDCLLNRLFRHRSKKTLKLQVTGLCERNSPVNSTHKGPVTRKMFPFGDVIMWLLKHYLDCLIHCINCFLRT